LVTLSHVRLSIYFQDGEVVDADSDSINQSRLLFVVRPRGGNNRLAWISFGSIKYVTFPDTPAGQLGDPKLDQLDKVVLRFADGAVMRAYKDDAFSQEGFCFNIRLWNQADNRLERAIVSVFALKAVFFVDQWDSRVPLDGPARPEARTLASIMRA